MTAGVKLNDMNHSLEHGDVVIAAVTSCTNTSNPELLVAAGLIAKKAAQKGLFAKPWVKTSFAPGSKVVTSYLENAGLMKYLDRLGFNLTAYGCTTCIGNSGPLRDSVQNAIAKGDHVTVNILSGNRNFEGRINPLSKASYLASPPLVVLYALTGSIRPALPAAMHLSQLYHCTCGFASGAALQRNVGQSGDGGRQHGLNSRAGRAARVL